MFLFLFFVFSEMTSKPELDILYFNIHLESRACPGKYIQTYCVL